MSLVPGFEDEKSCLLFTKITVIESMVDRLIGSWFYLIFILISLITQPTPQDLGIYCVLINVKFSEFI